MYRNSDNDNKYNSNVAIDCIGATGCIIHMV